MLIMSAAQYILHSLRDTWIGSVKIASSLPVSVWEKDNWIVQKCEEAKLEMLWWQWTA